MGIKIATEGYVIIKNLLHYGEHAVPHKGLRTNVDGEIEREFIVFDCAHGLHVVWFTRKDI